MKNDREHHLLNTFIKKLKELKRFDMFEDTDHCWQKKYNKNGPYVESNDIDDLINNLLEESEFFEDCVGGMHGLGVGYHPDGHFCGECVKQTCVSCVNFNNGEV